jgi:hypothetical protein
MNQPSSICKSMTGFAILIMLISTGCNTSYTTDSTPTVVATSTPEPLTLIHGKIDACLLITPADVESIVGNKVTSEILSPTGMTGCKYISVTDDQVVLQVYVATDTTIKEDEFLSSIDVHSATEDYELRKMGELNFEKEMSGIYKVEDISNLGDQAFMSEGIFLTFYVLNKNIFYQFVTRIHSGLDYDELMKLVQLALPRMPVSPIEKELSSSDEGVFGIGYDPIAQQRPTQRAPNPGKLRRGRWWEAPRFQEFFLARS